MNSTSPNTIRISSALQFAELDYRRERIQAGTHTQTTRRFRVPFVRRSAGSRHAA